MHAHQPLPPALGADQAARRRATCSHAIKDRPGQTRVGENTRVRTRSGERAYLLLLLLLLFFFIFFDQGNHHAWPTSSISILEPPTSAAPQQARRSCGRRTCKSHAPPRLFTPDALLVSAAPPPIVVTRRSVIFRTSAWRGSRSSIAPTDGVHANGCVGGNGRKNLRQPSNRANAPHPRAISKQAADVGAAHVTSHVPPWEFTREGSDGGGAGNTISTTTARCAPRFSRTTKVPGAKQQSTAVGRELDQGGIQYHWYECCIPP